LLSLVVIELMESDPRFACQIDERPAEEGEATIKSNATPYSCRTL
jgi:hypothetical protein